MDDEKVYAISERVAILQAQHQAKEKALELIAVSLADYKAQANEWRGTVQDIIGKNPTRLEMQAMFDRLSDKVAVLERAENKSEGKSSGIGMSWGIVVALAGLGLTMLIVGASIAALFLKGH
jgi:hypothetical protein